MFLSFNSLGIYLLQNFRFVWHNVICQKNVQYSSIGATVAEIVIKVLCIAAAGIIFNIIIEKIYKILRLDVLTEKLCKKLNLLKSCVPSLTRDLSLAACQDLYAYRKIWGGVR